MKQLRLCRCCRCFTCCCVCTHTPPLHAATLTPQKPSLLEATSAAQAGGPYGRAAAAAAGGDGGRLLHPVAGRTGVEEGLNPSCLTRIFCSAMPWVDCTRLRYHCTKLPDVNLCPLVGVGCWVVVVGVLSMRACRAWWGFVGNQLMTGKQCQRPCPGRGDRNAGHNCRQSTLLCTTEHVVRVHAFAPPVGCCRVLWFSQAYAQGRFPANTSSKDFVRIDDGKRHNSADGWTPEETML